MRIVLAALLGLGLFAMAGQPATAFKIKPAQKAELKEAFKKDKRAAHQAVRKKRARRDDYANLNK